MKIMTKLLFIIYKPSKLIALHAQLHDHDRQGCQQWEQYQTFSGQISVLVHNFGSRAKMY